MGKYTPQRLRVPLFPLPNVVLFPGAILPLHVFEERYKRMTADAIDGDGLIGMALLRPGWEKEYYTRPAIEPVVCVGRVVAHERLDDGKFNFLLQGQVRAKIISEEKGDLPYRVARVEPLSQTPTMEIDLTHERQRLLNLFGDAAISTTDLGRHFMKLLAGPISTAEAADLIAFNFLEDVQLKQSVLSDADVARRVRRVVGAIGELKNSQPLNKPQGPDDPSRN